MKRFISRLIAISSTSALVRLGDTLVEADRQV